MTLIEIMTATLQHVHKCILLNLKYLRKVYWLIAWCGLVGKAGDVEEVAADLKYCFICISVAELAFDLKIIHQTSLRNSQLLCLLV